VTPSHQRKTAALAHVDLALSERLNQEQNMAFTVPTQMCQGGTLGGLAEQLNLTLGPGGLTLRVTDVLFQTGESNLTAAARERLGRIATTLAAYPGLTVNLEGYTDSTGGRGYNLQLSRRRAAAVRNYLIAQGVTADKMTTAGFGENDPAATNATAAGRQKNRRVEMEVKQGED
jgi:outer membrane protein OmpA-like peptidoglycan-associated protein